MVCARLRQAGRPCLRGGGGGHCSSGPERAHCARLLNDNAHYQRKAALGQQQVAPVSRELAKKLFFLSLSLSLALRFALKEKKQDSFEVAAQRVSQFDLC